VTGERFADVGRGITLCYDEIGDAGGRPLLLVAGLGQQLHSWPTDFCRALADEGFRVVRFDNRDVGRSTHLDFRPPSVLAMVAGRIPAHQYHLGDMARDAAGLLAAIDLPAAHVAGASMGGMIAQTLAAHHPDRVLTLTSIMSTTGARRTGRPAASTWRRMLARPPATRQAAMDAAAGMFRHIGSHGFPFDEAAVRAIAGEAWDRDPTTVGVTRQLAGILASGDRTAELRSITAPTLVVHGDRDRMVHPSGATATARAIPGARLVTIPGMGHDLPVGAWPRLVSLITEHATATATP
jgi:pimeloyl-ACP methyl ester carboxylesterase